MKKFLGIPLMCLALGPASGSEKLPLRFNRDVRPILSDRCFACHGPDENKRDSGLRLDVRASAVAALPEKPGVFAIVPGDTKSSTLVQRILSEDPDQVMPPSDSHLKLSMAEKEILVRWVKEGAVFEKHWAYVRPEKDALPKVKQADWVTSPMDVFVLARLEKEGLAPEAEAAALTLIRRLHLDITGLPPTRSEVASFVADKGVGRWERLVDRLLASPHYGERMALPWLDLARYADTHGYQADTYRNMWPWRDWVLRAFNDNMPFDQFTIEQLAGDMLPEAKESQIVASGFNRNHRVNTEGGVIAEEYRIEYVADRTETTGAVWMGLTMNCCRCHDHKYDSLSQEDYYSLFAYFNNVPENGKAGKAPIAEPSIKMRPAGWHAELKPLQADVSEAQAALLATQKRVQPRFEKWATSLDGQAMRLIPKRGLIVAQTFEKAATPSEPQRVAGREGNGFRIGSGAPHVLLTSEGKPAGNWERDQAFTVSAWVKADAKITTPQTIVGRMDSKNKERGWNLLVYPNGTFTMHLISTWPKNALKVESAKSVIKPGIWQHLAFTVDGSSKAKGVRLFVDGQSVPTKKANDNLSKTARTKVPTHVGLRSSTFPATQCVIDEVRLYDRALSLEEMRLLGGGADNTIDGLAHKVRVRLPAKGILTLAEVEVFSFGKNVAPQGKANQSSTAYGGVPQRAIDGNTKGVQSAQSLSHTSGKDVPSWEVLLAKAVAIERVVLHNRTEKDIGKRLNGAIVEVLDAEGVVLWEGVVKTPAGARQSFAVQISPLKRLFATPAAKWNAEERRQMLSFYIANFDQEVQQAEAKVAAARSAVARHEGRFDQTMVMKEMEKPRTTYLLTRGLYDQPDKERIMTPRPPESIDLPLDDFAANRLGLARWLVHPDHPLTARVMVNRMWQELFGTGLVKTSEDFGVQGEWPSHPALLDWLARDFVDHGWDMKRLVKQMVMSATYRQAAVTTPEKLEKDPFNRLLSRGPRFRLRAQLIRDQALAASGLLVSTIGGPSVKPYQPPGLWSEVSFATKERDTDFYRQDTGDKLYRRGLYTFWKRTLNPPGMAAFDAASREYCVVRVQRTNSPLQALNMLNDPTYLEASRKLAERMMKEGGARVEERIAFGYQVLLVDKIPGETLRRLTRGLADYRSALAADPEAVEGVLADGASPVDASLDREELAAYSLVASVLLNLDGTVTRP